MPSAVPPTMPRRSPGWVVFAVGLFFAMFGGAMFLAAGKLYFKQSEFLSHSEHAVGTVVDFKKSIETNSRNQYQRRTFFAPIFTFTDRTGTTRSVISKVSDGDKPGYRIGQTVPILYHRDRPDEAELDTFFASWGGPVILGGMGIVFCALGGAFAINGLRTMLRGGTKPGLPGMGGGGDVPRDPAILAGP